MKQYDFRYLCTSIGNLAGIPVRLYRGGKQVFFYSVVKLVKDPLDACRGNVLQIDTHVGYYVTEQFNYYGIVNAGEHKIVIGPTRQTENSEQELRALAFRAGVEPADTDLFVAAMRTIVRMPLEGVLQMMCMINYVLNGEKITPEDCILHEQGDEKRTKLFENARESTAAAPAEGNVHNTLLMEDTVMSFIAQGQAEKFREWLRDAMPAVNGGMLAGEQLRHLKNTLIVTATLAARAAMRGGMDAQDALSLSDEYIRRCETLRDPLAVSNMQYRMILDYCGRVKKIRQGENPSRLVIAVTNYIQHHLSEPITTGQIAEHLFMGRTRLSANFKAQAGQTLSSFIRRQKTDEAKRLLLFTDKSASAIAAYLGFSSPAHFTCIFRKECGILPSEFREKYKNS